MIAPGLVHGGQWHLCRPKQAAELAVQIPKCLEQTDYFRAWFLDLRT